MPPPSSRVNIIMAHSTTIAPALIAALLLPAAAVAQGVPTARIFDALALRSGATVCEVGAGDGELSIAAAARVGDQGRVYTNELGSERLAALRAKVAASGRPNIQVVEAGADRTNFPDGACDALFMRNVYHHFAAPGPMTASLAASLRPGGRLAIVDFSPRGGVEARTPEDRDEDATHGVTPESVRRELADAGFVTETTETGQERWFIVVAVRPGS